MSHDYDDVDTGQPIRVVKIILLTLDVIKRLSENFLLSKIRQEFWSE